MQRRAAAIYFAFFLVVGLAAYAYIGVAQDTQQPGFSLDGTTLGAEESTTIDGTEYTVSEIGAGGGGGGGHGGGGGGEVSATLEWTNESAQHEETFENGGTVEIENQSYTVEIANESEVSSFTLREEQNVSAILADDPDVADSTLSQGDTEYVVYNENESIQPLSEYLSAAETREYAEGDSFAYQGEDATVVDVTQDAATVQWTAPEDESADLEEGTNVTLGGEDYFAHFPSGEQVQLVPSDQYDQYSQTQDERDYFEQRLNGLWGVVIVSFSAACILLATAYLPTRG